jgi:hypothetical protein
MLFMNGRDNACFGKIGQAGIVLNLLPGRSCAESQPRHWFLKATARMVECGSFPLLRLVCDTAALRPMVVASQVAPLLSLDRHVDL